MPFDLALIGHPRMVGRRPINGTPMTRKELAQRAYDKRKRVIADLDKIIVDLHGEILRIGLEVMAAQTLYEAHAVVTKALMKRD